MIKSTSFTFAEKVILDKGGVCVYDLSSVNQDGKDVWYVIAISKSKNDKFLKDIELNDFDLKPSDYGKIIAYGEGENTPTEVKKKIKEIYNFDL